MKQKLCAALLCGALVLGLSAPAGASAATSHSFLEVDRMTIGTYGAHGFHDGMLAIEERFTPYSDPHKDRYLREDGKVIIFDGAFGYDYSEGLVAVVNQDHKVGYADLEGKLVIPYQFDLYVGFAALKTGTFFNGRCPVFFKTGDAGDVDYDAPNGTMYGTWKTIDRTGKIVSDDHNPEHVFSRGDGYFTDEKGVLKTNNSGYTYYEPVEFEGKVHPFQEFSGDLGIFYASYVDPTDTRMFIVRRNASGTQPRPPQSTYGQSAYKSLGYSIVGNIGYLNIEVTNSGTAPDEGDLFYVLYNKYVPGSRLSSAEGFVPGDYLRQIHYKLAPGETKVLRVGVGQTGDIGRDLTDTELTYGWFSAEHILESRYVLAQAETEAERDELITLFKSIHYFGETPLSYEPDVNGVIVLAAPGGTLYEKEALDEMLATFTAQF